MLYPARRNTAPKPPEQPAIYPGMGQPQPGDPASSPMRFPGDKFQQSIDTQRATEANRAATFAAASPLPTGARGMYSGAFGEGAAGEKAAMAARQAYVAGKQMTAEASAQRAGMGSLQGQRHVDDENARMNRESAAGTAYIGQQGNLLNAQAGDMTARGQLYGPQAAGLNAAADATRAGAEQTRAMYPGAAAAQAAATKGMEITNAGNALQVPLSGRARLAEITAQEEQNRAAAAQRTLFPGMSSANIGLINSQAQLNDANAEVTRRLPNPPEQGWMQQIIQNAMPKAPRAPGMLTPPTHPGESPAPAAKAAGKQLDQATAMMYFKKYGSAEAGRQAALKDGWVIPKAPSK